MVQRENQGLAWAHSSGSALFSIRREEEQTGSSLPHPILFSQDCATSPPSLILTERGHLILLV